MNHHELRAMRQTLGLTETDIAKYLNITLRMVQYYSKGEREIPADKADCLGYLMRKYQSFHEKLLNSIQHSKRGISASQECVAFPFYDDFERFKAVFETDDYYLWRVYQAAVSHLYAVGMIDELNSEAAISQSIVDFLKAKY